MAWTSMVAGRELDMFWKAEPVESLNRLTEWNERHKSMMISTFLALVISKELNESNRSTVSLPGYIISKYYVTFATQKIGKH